MGHKHPSYAGSILRVDLTAHKLRTEPTASYSERWIGGRAINTAILLDEFDTTTQWSDPGSILAFGAGTLVGTSAPGACRVSVECKNAFNNGMGSANFGGFFGAELKFSGFDHIVITGKSVKPVYLRITDGQAELEDASEIWGKTTWETERHIRRQLGDERTRIAAIGPAGENLVRCSGIIGDRACAAGGSASSSLRWRADTCVAV